jgi:pimeloyl-ACP methyl ester carboxylesterase
VANNIDGPLYWERIGKVGGPMLFVHPNPMDNSCWLYQMAHFSTWFQTVGVDLPGYGRSPRARAGVSMQDVARACWEALDEVSREPAIIVGLSVGVHVVLHMANLEPHRTRAVIMSGSGYYPVKKFPAERIASYQEQGVAFRYPYTLEDFSPTFAQTEMAHYFARLFTERNQWADVGSIIEVFRALEAPDEDSLFEGISMPSLIVTGSLDKAHQPAFALQARIPGCELSVMQNAGHACSMERPWEWDSTLLEFLERHDLMPRPR